MTMLAYQMRPVPFELNNGKKLVSAADHEFLLQLYMSVRAEELERAQFPIEQRYEFCRSQLALRDAHYFRFYPNAEDRIVELAGEPIGHELVDRSEPVILLMDIALMPEFRGLGVGSALLAALCEEADKSARRICLHVEKDSPALRLYQRFGFAETEDCGLQFEMRRQPKAV